MDVDGKTKCISQLLPNNPINFRIQILLFESSTFTIRFYNPNTKIEKNKFKIIQEILTTTLKLEEELISKNKSNYTNLTKETTWT